MKKLIRIGTIMQKEILHILRDKIMFMIAFVAPIALMLLFGFIYIQNSVVDIPIVVFDQDQTDISRGIIRAFSDSEKFIITGQVTSYQELENTIQTEKAYMGVVIPPHLKERLKNGQASEVAIIMNGANILVMNTVANAANQIIQTISAGVTMQVMEGFGMAKKKAYQAVTAVSFRTRIWYNPATSYLIFMLLGLLGTAIQQLTFLGVALSFSKEREQGGLKQLLTTKLKWSEIIVGKSLVYLIIYTFEAVLMYGLAIFFFKVPMRGDSSLLILSTVIFMFSLIAMGMAISLLATSTAQAIQLSMLIAVPSFLISGYTWPYMSMPGFLQVITKLLPLTHYLEIIRSIVLMGNGLEVIFPKLITLGIFGLIFLPLTAIILKWRLQAR